MPATTDDRDPIAWRQGPPLPADRHRNVLDGLVAVSASDSQRAVLFDHERTWSFNQIFACAKQLQAEWCKRFKPSERIAIVAPNGAAHLIAELAAWASGLVALPCPPHLIAELPRWRPALLVTDHPDPPSQLAVWPLERIIDRPSDAGEIRPFWPSIPPDRICLALLTSGSTGRPKAVALTHDNICSQQSAFAQIWPDVGPGDRLVAYLPWYHSFGALAERLWALHRGAAIHLVPGDGHDHDALLASLERVRPTVFMSVPRMHRIACAANVFRGGNLRWAFTAGAPLGAEAEAWYATHGIPVYEGWGLTESSPSATITPPDRPRRPGVVGEPIPGVGVGVRQSDGRLFIRGPGVMAGYLDDPEATARACPRPGLLDSGDCGRWTADGLALLGRADQVLKLETGEKVAAARIEQALQDQAGFSHVVAFCDAGRLAVLVDHHRRSGDPARAIIAHNRHCRAPAHRIARAWLRHAPWTTADGCLTPSHKVSREKVLQEFTEWRHNPGPTYTPLTLR